jgi:energy-converting hydrogenase A subunit R
VHFIPDGARFFTQLSKYDDFLADIEQKPGYKSGDTLKLILPFLKAFGATDREIKKFCQDNLSLVPFAGETLRVLCDLMPSFIISTSYEPYVQALCDRIAFPVKHAYYTSLTLDRFQVSGSEAARLRKLALEIIGLPVLNWEEKITSRSCLSLSNLAAVTRLDAIFWGEVLQMSAGVMLRAVNPVGGTEKANAIKDILTRFQGSPDEIIFCGDSITDVEAFKVVRAGGGLTIAFNGNRYALQEAEIACISTHAVPVLMLADAFRYGGGQAVRQMVREKNYKDFSDRYHYAAFFPQLIQYLLEKFPKMEIITDHNRDNLIKESEQMRKTLRGETIGMLG